MPNNNNKNYANTELEDHNANIELEIQCLKKLEKIQVLIDKLGFEDPLNADEFV